MNRLSADLFEQIVASLRSDSSGRLHEKRNRPRVGLRSSLEILPCPEIGSMIVPPPSIVWVRDVSADGLGFVCPRSFSTDLQFVAEFDRFDGAAKLRVQYRVAYCKMISRGLYSVGARLVQVLPDKTTAPAKPLATKFA